MEDIIRINRKLLSYFKCIETTALLSELIIESTKVENKSDEYPEYFCLKYGVKDIESRLFIGERSRKRCFEELINAGILEIKKIGIPARFHYKLCLEKIRSKL